MREREELSGYRLLKKIGYGGMSTVFEALDPSGERVALKRMNPGLVGDPVMRERLLREVSMLQRVSSSHVAQILDVELDDDVFIVTELIDGPTLEADIADNGVFKVQDLADLAAELAQALRSVHDVGVLHRDIKPSNIMIGEDGVVFIDFGISQAVGATRLTQAGSIAHTPGYIDPRIITGIEPDEGADWWALAAVVGFAACGHPLFHGAPAAIMRQVLQGEPDTSGMDVRVAQIIRAALVPDVSQRLSFDDLVEELRALDEFSAVDSSVSDDSFNDVVSEVVDESEEDTRVLAADPVAPTLIAPVAISYPHSSQADAPRAMSDESEGRSQLYDESVAVQDLGAGDPYDLAPARFVSTVSLLGLSMVAGWDVAIAGLVAGVTFFILTVIGLLRERYVLRRRRGKRGNFALVARLPLIVIHAVLLLAMGGGIAAFVGGAGAWFGADLAYSSDVVELRFVIVVAMMFGLVALWFGAWGHHARSGWRLVVREIAPSVGYYLFWSLVALLALFILVSTVWFGYQGIYQSDIYNILSA